MLIWFH